MSLPDPARSWAVIVGFPSYDTLDDLPAVANNVRRLQEILTSPHSWNLPAEHCLVLPPPSGPDAPTVSRDDVLDALHTAATAAEDALLVYFAGHGLLSESGELHLAVPRSDHRRLYRAVHYERVRHELVTNCRARSRLVILDCCYSGSALKGYMGADDVVANRARVEGTYIMTSAAKTAPALAPPGETYTAFTGELLAALEAGVPGASELLRTDEVFQHVRRRLANARPRRPIPQQRARNDGHSIALAHNRWTPPPPPPPASPALPVAPADTPGRRRRQRPTLTRVQARVIGAVAATALLTAGLGSDRPKLSCDVRLTRVGDECVGVSDGSIVFTPELDQTSKRISAENHAAAEKPHVTIALLTPMTAPDEQGRRRILEQVQGAYMAQHSANRSELVPAIRLVLAQPGRTEGGWRRLAGQLLDMVDDPRYGLRAVVGFDAGDKHIADAVRFLASRGVPTVGGSYTPEPPSGASEASPYTAWTSPSAGDQLRALASFSTSPKREERLLVEDQRRGDPYVEGLREAYKAQEPLPRRLTYDSSSARAPVSSSTFRDMVDSICSPKAGIKEIFFAGRPAHLRLFLSALTDRACRKDPNVTVVSGSDTTELAHERELLRKLRDQSITVRYTAAAHPDMWAKTAPQEGTEAQRTDARRAMNDALRQAKEIGAPDLADGETITVHDSALTAIAAIHASAPASSPLPSTSDVGIVLRRLHGRMAVRGASGWICPDDQGYPYNKAVAVLTLDGKSALPRLNGVAWPEGKPTGCLPPRTG
ncbi:caspase, EACC1-associated type [Streptomyces asiaticus]|uniref:caspase, EACC1-associated type n=1 Tax=Streptomyces asiaticus TaxID=114695 RepID=UPI003D71FC0A